MHTHICKHACTYICSHIDLHTYTLAYLNTYTCSYTNIHTGAHTESTSSPHPNPVACFFLPFTFCQKQHGMIEKTASVSATLSSSLSFPSLKLGLQGFFQGFSVRMNWSIGRMLKFPNFWTLENAGPESCCSSWFWVMVPPSLDMMGIHQSARTLSHTPLPLITREVRLCCRRPGRGNCVKWTSDIIASRYAQVLQGQVNSLLQCGAAPTWSMEHGTSVSWLKREASVHCSVLLSIVTGCHLWWRTCGCSSAHWTILCSQRVAQACSRSLMKWRHLGVYYKRTSLPYLYYKRPRSVRGLLLSNGSTLQPQLLQQDLEPVFSNFQKSGMILNLRAFLYYPINNIEASREPKNKWTNK